MPRDTSTIVQLIDLVKCQPVLYDMTHPEFKNVFLKSKLWEEIGGKLNIDGNSARTKWKNLRDSYSKYLKSLKTTTGQSAAKTYDWYNKWQWASNLEFLRDHIGFATTDTNVTPDTDSETQNTDQNINIPRYSSPEHSISSLSPQSATVNRKRNNRSDDERGVDKVIKYLNTRKSDNMSSTEHLMIGYAKTIDSFSERRKILIKMKIAQIIMEAELEEQEERNSTSSAGLGPRPARYELQADAQLNRLRGRESTSVPSDRSTSACSQYDSLSPRDSLLFHNSHGQEEQEHNIDLHIDAQTQSPSVPGTSNICQEIRSEEAANNKDQDNHTDFENESDSFLCIIMHSDSYNF